MATFLNSLVGKQTGEVGQDKMKGWSFLLTRFGTHMHLSCNCKVLIVIKRDLYKI